MRLYLTAKTAMKDLVIEYIEVRLTNGKEVTLSWDESEFGINDGVFTDLNYVIHGIIACGECTVLINEYPAAYLLLDTRAYILTTFTETASMRSSGVCRSQKSEYTAITTSL